MHFPPISILFRSTPPDLNKEPRKNWAPTRTDTKAHVGHVDSGGATVETHDTTSSISSRPRKPTFLPFGRSNRNQPLPAEIRTAVDNLDVDALTKFASTRRQDLLLRDAVTGDTPLLTLVKRSLVQQPSSAHMKAIEVIANATKETTQFDRLGAAPIYYSVCMGNVPVTEALIKAGAEVPKFIWRQAIGNNSLGEVLEPGVIAFAKSQSRRDFTPWPKPAGPSELVRELATQYGNQGASNVASQVGSASKAD